MSEQPTITQSDRDAAEAIYPAFLASLKGDDGGYGLAEAFARHRTGSLAAQDGLVERRAVNIVLAKLLSPLVADVGERIIIGNNACDEILAALSAIKADKP